MGTQQCIGRLFRQAESRSTALVPVQLCSSSKAAKAALSSQLAMAEPVRHGSLSSLDLWLVESNGIICYRVVGNLVGALRFFHRHKFLPARKFELVKSLWQKSLLMAGRRAFHHQMRLHLVALHPERNLFQRSALPLPWVPKSGQEGKVGHSRHQTLYCILGYAASEWRG